MCSSDLGKTPLQYARTPYMDKIAATATIGTVLTVPVHMTPASDVANLSLMGYDPNEYYRGRSPLEAVSMGISLEDTDMTFRCNLVTLSDGMHQPATQPLSGFGLSPHSRREVKTSHAMFHRIRSYQAGCLFPADGRSMRSTVCF